MHSLTRINSEKHVSCSAQQHSFMHHGSKPVALIIHTHHCASNSALPTLRNTTSNHDPRTHKHVYVNIYTHVHKNPCKQHAEGRGLVVGTLTWGTLRKPYTPHNHKHTQGRATWGPRQTWRHHRGMSETPEGHRVSW